MVTKHLYVQKIGTKKNNPTKYSFIFYVIFAIRILHLSQCL